MKKNLTEIVCILDRSGSMAGLEDDTIGGFNAFVEKQKKESGEAILSTVLFDDRSEVIYDRVDLRQVEPMTDAQYCVGGCTALLDAVGGAIHHIGNVHKYAREEDRPEKTIFIITTDGMENAAAAIPMSGYGRWWSIRRRNTTGNFCFWAPTSTPSKQRHASASPKSGL